MASVQNIRWANQRTCNLGRSPSFTSRAPRVIVRASAEAALSRRTAGILVATGVLLFSQDVAHAKDYKDALKEKEARKAALRGAAKEMKSSGKDEQVFEESAYSVSEEARTPNVHSRQQEGVRTQQNI